MEEQAQAANQDDTLEDDDLDWQEGSVERQSQDNVENHDEYEHHNDQENGSQEWHKTTAEDG